MRAAESRGIKRWPVSCRWVAARRTGDRPHRFDQHQRRERDQHDARPRHRIGRRGESPVAASKNFGSVISASAQVLIVYMNDGRHARDEPDPARPAASATARP